MTTIPPSLAALRARAGSWSWLRVGPFVVLCIILIGAPLALLVTYAFRSSSFAGVGAGPTLDQFQAVFQSEGTLRVILKTVAVGIAVASLVTALALVIAYGATFRLRRRTALIALMVVLGAGLASFIVRIYAWGTILGTNGLANRSLEQLGLIDRPLGFLFFGYFAIVVTMTYVYLPIGVLIVYGAMQDIDPRTVEASRDLGVGRWRTLTRIVMPQGRAGLLGCFGLTAVLSAADYITPQIVGGVRGQTIGTLIRDKALSSLDYPAAAALALSYIAIFILVVAAAAGGWRLTHPLRRRLSRTLDVWGTRLVGRTPAFLARVSFSRPTTAILVAYLVAPTVVVLVFSFNSSITLGLPWKGFTLDWYPNIIGKPGFTDALSNSLEIALIAVLGSSFIGVPYAMSLKRFRGRTQRFLWGMVLLPWVIPGVLLGLGILTAADQQGLQLGVAVTAAVHVLLLAPIVILVIYARLIAMNPELTEAARDLGSSPARAFRTVTLPLILPSLIGAALICAAFSLDEILVTTFTIGSNNTVPIWLLGQARLGFTPGVNALGVMLMSGTVLFVAIAIVTLRRVSSRTPLGGS